MIIIPVYYGCYCNNALPVRVHTLFRKNVGRWVGRTNKITLYIKFICTVKPVNRTSV